jgi:monofunctional biosynthetic peptidoglycan transglycosylase
LKYFCQLTEVIASEDGSFLIHNGFDFKAMQKTYKGMREVGKVVVPYRNKQLKNVFLWQGRSYFRKGLEAYFTVLIEFIWGKAHHGVLE